MWNCTYRGHLGTGSICVSKRVVLSPLPSTSAVSDTTWSLSLLEWRIHIHIPPPGDLSGVKTQKGTKVMRIWEICSPKSILWESHVSRQPQSDMGAQLSTWSKTQSGPGLVPWVDIIMPRLKKKKREVSFVVFFLYHSTPSKFKEWIYVQLLANLQRTSFTKQGLLCSFWYIYQSYTTREVLARVDRQRSI